MPTTHDSNEGKTQYWTPEEQMRAEFDLWWTSPSPIGESKRDIAWRCWQACAAKSAEKIATLNDINSAQATMLGERNETIARLEEESKAWELLANSLRNRMAELNTKLAAAQADNARLREALNKIDVLRKDIIERQSIGWSSHVYPLVAILDEVLPIPTNQNV